MNMRYSYIREKLGVAIEVLATGKGDVRARLLEAYMSFHTLNKDNFPTELQKDWEFITKSLTKFDPISDYKGKIIVGRVENTLMKIRNSTGQKIAQKLWDLNFELRNNEKYL